MVVGTGGCFTSFIFYFLFLFVWRFWGGGLTGANNGGGRGRCRVSFMGRYGQYGGTRCTGTGLVTEVGGVQEAKVVTTVGFRDPFVFFSTI